MPADLNSPLNRILYYSTNKSKDSYNGQSGRPTVWIEGAGSGPVGLGQVDQGDVHLGVKTSARLDHVQLNAMALAGLKSRREDQCRKFGQ